MQNAGSQAAQATSTATTATDAVSGDPYAAPAFVRGKVNEAN